MFGKSGFFSIVVQQGKAGKGMMREVWRQRGVHGRLDSSPPGCHELNSDKTLKAGVVRLFRLSHQQFPGVEKEISRVLMFFFFF